MSSQRNRMLKRNRNRRLAEYRRILSAVWTVDELGALSDDDIEYLGTEYQREIETADRARRVLDRETAEREERERAERDSMILEFNHGRAERKRVSCGTC